MGLIILHFPFLAIRIVSLFDRFIYLFGERTLAFTHVNSKLCIDSINGVCFLFLIKLFIDKIVYKIFLLFTC